MSQALQLASYLKDIPRENVAIATLPGRPAYIEKVSYWIPDLAAAAEFLASTPTKPKIIENDGNTKEETAKAENTIQLKWPLVILNGDGKPRLAQRFAYLMQSKGLAEISYSGNAKHFDYKYTTVRIPKDFADEDINLVVTFFTTIGLKEEMIFKNSDVKTITLILGHDYERILKKLES
jgi:hypothetical protein